MLQKTVKETSQPSHDKISEPVPVATAVKVALLSEGVDVAKNYASQVVWDHFNGDKSAKIIISQVFNYAFTSLASLNPWLTSITTAVGFLAKVPEGVIAAVLWAIGKIWLSVANRFYNGSWIAKGLGDYDEAYIFTWLNSGVKAHEKLALLVTKIEQWIANIKNKLESRLGKLMGGKEDEPQKESQAVTKDVSNPAANIADNKFISLGIEQPKLKEWEESKDKRSRAGLEAQGYAQVHLLEQNFGGNVAVRLPFGAGWEVSVAPLFESKKNIGFSKILKAEQVKADELVINDKGLASFKTSIHKLNIADGRVHSDLLSLEYLKQQNEVHFSGDAHVPLWAKKQLDGDFDLKLDTAGKFKSGRAKLSSDDEFEVIPSYFKISKPSGEVEIEQDKAPSFALATSASLYGLPGGIKANITQAKVKYHDNELGGEIEHANIVIPATKNTTITLAMNQAKFSGKKIEASQAYLDLDYDADSKPNEEETFQGGIFDGGLQLGNIFDLKQLKLHQGLTSIKFENGKFTYDKDKDNGLQLLRTRILGVEAYWDGDKSAGGLAGRWDKTVNIPAIDFDVPALGGFAGGSVGVSGGFRFGAGVEAQLKKHEGKDKGVSVFDARGEFDAEAQAKAKIEAALFVGVPYLAKLQAGLFGEIRGSVAGRTGMTGRLNYTSGSPVGKFSVDNTTPVEGKYELKGALKAEVGASVKTKVLMFEKELASMTLGDWILGEYSLTGGFVHDGKEIKAQKTAGKFVEGKSQALKVEQNPIAVDDWVERHLADKTSIAYSESEAKAKISEVCRKLIYGDFSPERKAELKVSYSLLLKEFKQKEQLSDIYIEINNERIDYAPESNIWSSKVWDYAVNRRKVFIVFPQSSEKTAVSERLDEYHKAEVSGEKRRLLEKLIQDIEKYIKSSSTSSNKAAAEDLLRNIEKERKELEKEQV